MDPSVNRKLSAGGGSVCAVVVATRGAGGEPRGRRATADRPGSSPGGAARYTRLVKCKKIACIDGITIFNVNATFHAHVRTRHKLHASNASTTCTTYTPHDKYQIRLYNNSELDARAVLKDPPSRELVHGAKAVPSRYRSGIYLHGTPACWARRSPSTAMPLASCALTPTCAATWLG
jgi:hypothetical protein